MIFLKRFLSFLTLLLVCATSASATTYYVNVNTGDNSRSSAEAQNPSTPWKNVSYAVASVESGSLVMVAAGHYSTFEGERAYYSLPGGISVSGESTSTVTIEGTIGKGIVFLSLDTGSSLANCHVTTGTYLISSWPDDTPGGSLLYIWGQNVLVRDVLVTNLSGRGAAIDFRDGSSGTVSGCLITGMYGIWINTINTVTAELNSVVWCYSGLRAVGGTVRASGNIISCRPMLTDIYGTGIVGTATFALDHNCVWGNNTNYSGVTPGLTDISVLPRFLNGSSSTGDFRLFADSPCLGTGPGGKNIGFYQGSGVGTSNFRETAYVSGTGSDIPRPGAGSESSPWRSITQAANYAETAIYAGAGLYTAAAGETFPLGAYPYLRSLRGVSPDLATIEGDASSILRFVYPLTLEGFTLINSSVTPDGSILLVNSPNVRGDAIGNRLFWSGAYPAFSCGVYVKNSEGLVRNNEIRNVHYGVSVYKNSHAETATVEGNTIVKCRVGVAALNDTVYAKNNIICSSPEGIALPNSVGIYSSGETICSYNNVYLNAANYQNEFGGSGAAPGTGSLSLEALFNDVARDDYRLKPGSPCLGAGEGGANIGAYSVVTTTTTTTTSLAPTTTTTTSTAAPTSTTTTSTTTTTTTPIPADKSFSAIRFGVSPASTGGAARINLDFASRVNADVTALIEDLSSTPPTPIKVVRFNIREGQNILDLATERSWGGKPVRITIIGPSGDKYVTKGIVPAY